MEYFTVTEFAKKVKMHPASVRKAIKEGKIYATKFSCGIKAPYRIPESELERLHIQSMYESKK